MLRSLAFAVVASLSSLLLAQTPPASQPAWQKIPEGELILRPFVNAPFPHASRDAGYKTSAGKEFPKEGHYDDSTVGIFIPSGFVAGDEVDFVVHFHGHMNHVSKVLEQYKLPQQMVDAKVNAILLVPQGPKDAPDSGGGKLEEGAAFGKLINEVTKFLRDEKKIRSRSVGKIVLSAHSGGYNVTSLILYNGGMGRQISDVLLLDATYGNLNHFANFNWRNPGTRLVSLYTDHLAAKNQELMKLLSGQKVKYDELDEASVTDEQFAARNAMFMHTSAKHDEVPVKYFGRLLKTSALPKTGQSP